MSSELRGFEAFRHRAAVEAERYGDDPWVFVRELIQNARDAGAAVVRFDVAATADGGERIAIADDGEGMSLDDARRYLFTLYASSKRDSRDAAGRFGVGFWSVLRYRPDVIEVSSRGPAGAAWTVRLCDRLARAEILPSDLAAGTRIVLGRREPGADTADLVRRAVREEARLVRRRDLPETPLVVTVDGRRVSTGDELRPPLIRFRRAGLRGVVAFGERPSVELSVRGFRVRTVATLDDLRPGDPRRRPRGAARLSTGLAPRLVLDSDHVEVLMSRGEPRADRRLERVVRAAEVELDRLVRQELDRLAPRPWPARAVEAGRAVLSRPRAAAWSGIAAVLVAAAAGWWVGPWDGLAARFRSPAGAVVAADGPTAPSSSFRPLERRYRGPAVDGVAAVGVAPDIRYRPPEEAILIGALRIRSVDATGRVAASSVVGPAAAAPPCADRCLELVVRFEDVDGPLRLPFPTGTVVDPASVRVDGRRVAVARTAAGEPVIVPPQPAAGELRYRVAPGPDPNAVGDAGWPRVPDAFHPPASSELGRPPGETVAAVVARVARAIAYERGPVVAARYREALGTGRTLLEAALEVAAGDCDVQNLLVAAALGQRGIPARLTIGWPGAAGAARGGLHAWVEYRDLDGVWRIADASAVPTGISEPRAAPVAAPVGARPPPQGPSPARRTRFPALGAVIVAVVAAAVLAWRRRRVRREHEPGGGVALERLVDGAVRRPSAWRSAPALAERPLLATWSGRRVSVRRARRLAESGRLFSASDPGAASLGGRGVVLDDRRPECRAVAEGLGVPRLDRWWRRVREGGSDPGAEELERRLGRLGLRVRLCPVDGAPDAIEVLAAPAAVPIAAIDRSDRLWRDPVEGADPGAELRLLEELAPRLASPGEAKRLVAAAARRQLQHWTPVR